MVLDADVIVVGGGPCGLVTACELGRRGIRTLLFNDRETTSPHPQANATQARTMEHYRRLGFARRIREAGLPPDYPTDVAYFTRLTKHELARFELPAAGRADDLVRGMSGSWSAAELPHRCSQMYIERILREEAGRYPSVTLQFGARVLDAADEGDHVSVTFQQRDAPPTRVRARYLVGADGPRSEIRRRLGIELRGEVNRSRPFLAGRMYSIFLRSAALYDIIPWHRAWQYWVINPERRGALVALDGKGAFVYMTQLRPGEDDGPIPESLARDIVQSGVGRPFDFDIVERAPWTAGLTLSAERFQCGNIFLAGDAVHLFTPTGGLGYNAVEDAVNLGWKLAATLRGWGGPGLLPSYETEREPVARRNLGFSRHYADSTGNFVVPSDIEDETDSGAAARRAVGDYFNHHARAEFDIEEAFMPATTPIRPRTNKFYEHEDDYYEAVGNAMRTEYRAIVDAGFVLQIDDPHLADMWESHVPALSVSEYRKLAGRYVEIVNHALHGIPEDRVRFHICWGSWHGAHAHDLPLKHIVDLLLTVRAQGYAIEAANARHEHEWQLWRDVKLPDGKILIPGVVAHATNGIEHPELVAWRIRNFASVVGRENVMAGTDCGLGYRVHPQIDWAKFRALAEGARLASRELW